jgi:dihydrolipoamide dehydrogenase
MKFYLSHKVVGGNISNGVVNVKVEDMKQNKQIDMSADVVLVATGRSPFTNGLGLKNLGIETDKVGRIPINKKLQTKHEHIYAIGDVVEGPMLAHKGEEEGIAAVETILGLPGHVNYNAIPSVVYTHPEIAFVGLNEEECKQKSN